MKKKFLSDAYELVVEVALKAAFVIMALAIAYVICVWGPFSIYARSECLRAGYPVAYASIDLEVYCTTINDKVNTPVVHLQR